MRFSVRQISEGEDELILKYRQMNSEVEEVLKQKGYHEMGTNVFVPEDEAFDYALDRCMHGSELDQIEFRHMLVEWFYSGNWIKEE